MPTMPKFNWDVSDGNGVPAFNWDLSKNDSDDSLPKFDWDFTNKLKGLDAIGKEAKLSSDINKYGEIRPSTSSEKMQMEDLSFTKPAEESPFQKTLGFVSKGMQNAGIVDTDEDRKSKDFITAFISKDTGMPISDVQKDYDSILKDKYGFMTDKAQAERLMTGLGGLAVTAGAVTNPLGTALGLGVYHLLDKAIPTQKIANYLSEKATGEPLSDKASTLVDALDFIGKGVIGSGAFKLAPRMIEGFTKMKITELGLPKKVFTTAEDFKTLPAELQREIVRKAFPEKKNITVDDIRAVRDNGIDKTFDPEILPKYVDRPWFANLKNKLKAFPEEELGFAGQRPGEPKPEGKGEELPLLYHGTKSQFNSFEITKKRISDPGVVGDAVYFTPNKDFAEYYSKDLKYGKKGGTPRVVEAKVNLNNPLIITDGKLPDGRTLTNIHPNGISSYSSKAINKELIKKGYDGVIFKDKNGEVSQVAVFDTKTIAPVQPPAGGNKAEVPPPSEPPKAPPSAGQPESGMKERKFITSVKESLKTDPRLAKAIKGEYSPISNKETIAQADDIISKDLNKSMSMAMSPEKPTAIDFAIGQRLADKFTQEGNIEAAREVIERIAERATTSGQAIQALSMYSKLTPEGIVSYAVRQERKANTALPKEKMDRYKKAVDTLKSKYEEKIATEEAKIKKVRERIGTTKTDDKAFASRAAKYLKNREAEIARLKKEQDSMVKKLARKIGVTHMDDATLLKLREAAVKMQSMPEGREKSIAIAQILKEVADQIPKSFWKKVSSAQTIAQLLNPKTFIRNIGGNLGFTGAENIAQLISVPFDWTVSKITGERAVGMPEIKAQISGGVKGLKEGYQEAKLGINLRGNRTQYDIPQGDTFDSKIGKAAEKALRISLNAPDRAFYEAARSQSLMEQMKLAKVSEPTPDMIEQAHLDGLYRTFQDDSAIANAMQHIKKGLNYIGSPGQEWGLGDMVIKYPKTPGSLLSKGIEYSPFGYANMVYQLARAAAGKGFNQRKFSRAFGKAFMGSIVVGAGYLLAKAGLITGGPEKDKDISEIQRQTGFNQYRINLSALIRYAKSGMNLDSAKPQSGDTIITYDWFQPMAFPIAMGADMFYNQKMDAVDFVSKVAGTVASASETLQEQPLMTGVRRFMGTRNMGESVIEAIKSIPSSFVPTALKQVRDLTDNINRNTQTLKLHTEVMNSIANKTPVLSKEVIARLSSLGKIRKNYQDDTNTVFNVFFNPSFVSKYKPTPITNLVLGIWKKTGETRQAPRIAPKSVKSGEQTIELGPKKYYMYQKYIGEKTQMVFTLLLSNQKFMSMPDIEKAKIMEKYLTQINQDAKIEVLGLKVKK